METIKMKNEDNNSTIEAVENIRQKVAAMNFNIVVAKGYGLEEIVNALSKTLEMIEQLLVELKKGKE